MNDIIIKKITPSEAIDDFEEVLKTKVDSLNIVSVKVNYNTQKGLPEYLNLNIESYPVIMMTTNGYKICLYPFTAGNDDMGSKATVQVLKMAGFYFDKNYVISKKYTPFELIK